MQNVDGKKLSEISTYQTGEEDQKDGVEVRQTAWVAWGSHQRDAVGAVGSHRKDGVGSRGDRWGLREG
jgi:hypothetical protein